MKFNFENIKNTSKKIITGGAIVATSILPSEKSNAQTKDSDIKKSQKIEEGYRPVGLGQRDIYNHKSKYKKMVQEATTSEIKDYEDALLDPHVRKEDHNEIKKMINTAKEDALLQIKNYKKISKPYIKSFNVYDKQKKWLKKNISSNEYKKRLIEYEKMNDSTQMNRINNLKNEYILENHSINQYDPDVNQVTIEKSSTEPEMIHEGEHQVIHNENGMSDYAKELYKKAFVKTNTLDEQIVNAFAQGYNGSYYGNPEELDARKKVLEWDMERLHIKKYTEEFSNKHYQKLLELKAAGKLSRNSVEFLERISPEYIYQIMNTIAMNNNDDYHNQKWDSGNEDNKA